MTPSEEPWLPTRKSLLSRLRNQDDHVSWREFFDLYWRLIYGVARQAGLSEAEAEEVVQDTVITVAKQMPDFHYDQSKGSFKSWLRKTAHWRIKDQFRRRKRNDRFVPCLENDDSDVPPPEGAIDRHAFDTAWEHEWRQNLIQVAVDRVKAQVESREFQVFDLCTNKEWPAAKVARALNLLRPQVYYLNQKITRLIEREARRLSDET